MMDRDQNAEACRRHRNLLMKRNLAHLTKELVMRSRSILNIFPVAILSILALAPPASAALAKFGVVRGRLLQFGTSSPQAEYRNTLGVGVTLVDDSGASPVLKKFVILDDQSSTTVIPSLTGFIFAKRKSTTGPLSNQIGTGSLASSIDWGNTDGWTRTGGAWCNSVPSYVCTLGQLVYLETVTQPVFSSNYDASTWVFHGTGFTNPGGYIDITGINGTGNRQIFVRGPRGQDGTVPAIPVLGFGVVGLSVIAVTVASMRRRK